MLRVINDNGTPNCLPVWARDEIVYYRLKSLDWSRQIERLTQELCEARGMSSADAMNAGFDAGDKFR